MSHPSGVSLEREDRKEKGGQASSVSFTHSDVGGRARLRKGRERRRTYSFPVFFLTSSLSNSYPDVQSTKSPTVRSSSILPKKSWASRSVPTWAIWIERASGP